MTVLFTSSEEDHNEGMARSTRHVQNRKAVKIRDDNGTLKTTTSLVVQPVFTRGGRLQRPRTLKITTIRLPNLHIVREHRPSRALARLAGAGHAGVLGALEMICMAHHRGCKRAADAANLQMSADGRVAGSIASDNLYRTLAAPMGRLVASQGRSGWPDGSDEERSCDGSQQPTSTSRCKHIRFLIRLRGRGGSHE